MRRVLAVSARGANLRRRAWRFVAGSVLSLACLLLLAAPLSAANPDDEDGDGLSNQQEEELGTNPTLFYFFN